MPGGEISGATFATATSLACSCAISRAILPASSMCADFGSFGSTIQENGKLLSSNEDTGTVRVAEVDGVLDRECRCGPEWLL